ncbi:MAG: AzlC family ABC transporter permease [Firmicutes bacterium]|nr:AzlC family ABC transporter permease [Bacillota bacterium]
MEKRSLLISGIKAGLPIAIGYIPIAITFGLLAKSTGIPNYITVCMSLIVFAGASQFVGVKLMAIGATSWEIIMTTFILNFRHFLMSSSLSRKIESGTSKKWLSIISFGITDESFTVASLRKENKLSPIFLLALNTTAFSAWVSGTAVGVFLATGLPGSLTNSMGIALYAMFIGLLVPSVKGSKPILLVALTAMITSYLIGIIPFLNNLSSGWSIIIATITAALIGAILYPRGVKN